MKSYQWLFENVLPTLGVAVMLVVSILAFTITLSNYASDPVAPENFLHHNDNPHPSSASTPVRPPSCVEASGVTVGFSPAPSAVIPARKEFLTAQQQFWSGSFLENQHPTGGTPLINQAVNFSGSVGILENADLSIVKCCAQARALNHKYN